MGKIKFGNSETAEILESKSIIEIEKLIDVPVEVIVEKIVEVPVEIIKEVVREVEVIKEVPVEVVREVEKIIEIPIIKVQERLIEDTSRIEELITTIKDLDLINENNRLYSIKLKAELRKQTIYKWLAIAMIGVALCL